MRTSGIVCEYNPFHNGHLDHMTRTKALPGSDYVVCVMSSDFLQRGEPAVLPKELRARSAVLNGADLVLELPSVFSCSSAEYYASSAVAMMARLGIVDSIVFGSENPDVSTLGQIASLLAEEPEGLSVLIKDKLNKGVSFAEARQLAVAEYSQIDSASSVIEGSNNILGIEYIKAIMRKGYPIKPVAIPRIAEEYKQSYIEGNYPSATAIRRRLIDEGLDSVKPFLPPITYEIMKDFYNGQQRFIEIEMLREAVFYRIASLTEEQLMEFDGVSEGLENRLKSCLEGASTLAGYIDSCTTRRYPATRISRALMHILLDIKKHETERIRARGPVYARLLAASKAGMSLIPVIERNSSIPVFTSFKGFYDNATPGMRKLLDIERKASDIYSASAGIKPGREYTIHFETY